MQLTLMTTAGCHLCDQALLILEELAASRGFSLELVDVAEDDELIERYGVRIPVVVEQIPDKAGQSTKELGWPFSLEELDSFFFTSSRGVVGVE